MANNKPIHEIAPEPTWATIWEHIHVGQDRCFGVAVRAYKRDGPWEKTSSLGPDDLLVLAEVLDQAHTWIAARRSNRQKLNNPPAGDESVGIFNKEKTT